MIHQRMLRTCIMAQQMSLAQWERAETRDERYRFAVRHDKWNDMIYRIESHHMGLHLRKESTCKQSNNGSVDSDAGISGDESSCGTPAEMRHSIGS